MVTAKELVCPVAVAVSVVATVRPTGNAGDQEDSTEETASTTNSGGVSLVADVETAVRALSNTGLGSRGFSAVRFFVKATTSVSGGATINSKELVVKKGLLELTLSIQADGEWESVGSMRIDPDGVQWTGASIDSAEVYARVNATLPPGASASVAVKEIRAEAVDYHVRSGGRAGYLVGVGRAL